MNKYKLFLIYNYYYVLYMIWKETIFAVHYDYMSAKRNVSMIILVCVKLWVYVGNYIYPFCCYSTLDCPTSYWTVLKQYATPIIFIEAQ